MRRLIRSTPLPLLAATLGAGIFVVDTFVFVHDALSVLYIIVVLLAANFLGRRGVVLVTLACFALAAATYLIQHGPSFHADSAVRLAIGIVAVGSSAVLSLINLSAVAGLKEQAALLDLSNDAIMTRDMNGMVTYWNSGAQALYGWASAEAIGKSARALLKFRGRTLLAESDATLQKAGRWEGELTCERRDGQQLTITSRCALIRDRRRRAIGVMETDTDITDRRRAEEELRQSQLQLAHVTRATNSWRIDRIHRP